MAEENRTSAISILQIQIFMKAVEMRNFTRVAEYFNYTPSMISKNIASLEDSTGLRLFVRKPHELTPTPAAELLSSEWRRLVVQFQDGIKKARDLEAGIADTIRLGFVDSSDAVDRFMEKTLLDYRKVEGDITVIAEKHDMHRLSELLRSGMLDIIQTSSFETDYLDECGIAWEKVASSSAAAFVPRSNPLFSRESLTFEDLSDQPLASLDERMHPTYTEWLTSICRAHGFNPDITSTYRTVRSLLFSLRLHDSVFIGDSINADWCDEDLRCFLLPEPTFSLLAWRTPASPEVRKFRVFLKQRYSELLPKV